MNLEFKDPKIFLHIRNVLKFKVTQNGILQDFEKKKTQKSSGTWEVIFRPERDLISHFSAITFFVSAVNVVTFQPQK